MEEEDHRRQQKTHALEYFRHLTTLATGSIVILATFFEKFAAAAWRPLLVASFVGLLASLMGGVAAYTAGLAGDPRADESRDWEVWAGGVGMILAWAGFLVGIVALGVFAIRNFV